MTTTDPSYQQGLLNPSNEIFRFRCVVDLKYSCNIQQHQGPNSQVLSNQQIEIYKALQQSFNDSKRVCTPKQDDSTLCLAIICLFFCLPLGLILLCIALGDNNKQASPQQLKFEEQRLVGKFKDIAMRLKNNNQNLGVEVYIYYPIMPRNTRLTYCDFIATQGRMNYSVEEKLYFTTCQTHLRYECDISYTAGPESNILISQQLEIYKQLTEKFSQAKSKCKPNKDSCQLFMAILCLFICLPIGIIMCCMLPSKNEYKEIPEHNLKNEEKKLVNNFKTIGKKLKKNNENLNIEIYIFYPIPNEGNTITYCDFIITNGKMNNSYENDLFFTTFKEDVCPPMGEFCWDVGMDNGDCDGSIGPVYTELIPASNCTYGCWKAVSVIYLGTQERSGGNHNIWVKMMYQNGTYITSYPNGPWWTAYWGSDWDKPDQFEYNQEAKGENDWGDFPIYASDPDWEPATCGCPGPYGAFAGSVMDNSDIIWGMGLPVHQHVCWAIIWQFMDSLSAKKLDFKKNYLYK